MADRQLPPGVVSAEPVRYPVIFDQFNRPVSVVTRDGDLPFPPGAPPQPRVEEPGPPRVSVPAPLQNLIMQPRRQPGVDLTPFAQLRALAAFDLVRIVLEDLKGQAVGMDYEITVDPLLGKEIDPKSADVQKQVSKVRRWLEMPDPIGREEFDVWVGKLCEETLVTDALSIVPRHTRKGEFIALEILNGETITPKVDARGRIANFPAVGFQQYAHGWAERNFFTRASGKLGIDDELWYLPRNRRANTPYGYAEVERVLVSINLALRQQLFDLAFYTTGTIPDSIFALKELSATIQTWSAEKIGVFQKTFDDMLAGRDDRRAGNVRFTPEGTLFNAKERAWDYEFLEFLVRVIAWAFNVSPLPIMKNIGRNPSEQLGTSALKTGARPLANFIARVITRAIRDQLGFPNLVCKLSEDELESPKEAADRIATLVAARDAIGEPVLLAAEAREELGREAFTPAQLKQIADAKQAQIDQQMQLADAKAKSSGFGGGGGSKSGGDKKPDPRKAFEARRLEYADDLSKLRRRMFSAAREGKDLRKVVLEFRSTTIPSTVRERLLEDIGEVA